VRVLIAEDLALLRDGLTRLLRDNGFDVVDAVADGDALVHAARRERPDIAIVDIRLPPTFRDEGLRAAIELRATVPEMAILVVSQYVEHTYATELLAAGGSGVGYLLKDRIMNVDEFVDAVRRVADGGTALDSEVVAQLFSRHRQTGPLETLTPREREVLADGGGKVERRDRHEPRPDRRRRREAHSEHLHEAAPATNPGGAPPSPSRFGLPPRRLGRQFDTVVWRRAMPVLVESLEHKCSVGHLGCGR
jgi:DNA-binding NarL/FixJ family response regulator